jgi:6-bladed beta-propeller protein
VTNRTSTGAITFVAVCSLAIAESGCEKAAPVSPLVLIDSVVLNETEPDATVHRPSRIYLGNNGEFLIGDFTGASVLRFGPNGDFLNRIGRAGKGPGEFVSPAMIAVLDTAILIFDAVRKDAQLFRPTGEFLNSAFAVPFIADNIAIDDQSVWATGVTFDTPWSALRWNRRDGSVQWLMPKPPLWTELPILGALGGAHAAFGPGVTWMTFGGVDQVMRWRDDLTATPDTFPVPRRARRGIPVDRVKAGSFRGLGELFSAASGTADLSVLPDGGVAVLHKDLIVQGQSRTGTFYLTVLDSTGSAQCVDVQVPIPAETAPVTRLKADTLVVLEQAVPDSGEVRTVVRRWRIRSGPCSPET